MRSYTSDSSLHSTYSVQSNSSGVSHTSTADTSECSHSTPSLSSGGVSYTSSYTYGLLGHVPFDEYRSTVEELCQLLWPSATEDFIIERLKGGELNRIIGITTPPSTGDAQGRYILRIPRYEDLRVDREIANHRYVRQHTSIPMAELHFSDTTRKNPLRSPYVVLSRLPGETLESAWSTLTHEQKRTVIQELGKVVVAARMLKNGTAGVIEEAIHGNSAQPFQVRPFTVGWGMEDPTTARYLPDEHERTLPAEQSIRNMFYGQFDRWTALKLKYSKDPWYDEAKYSALSVVTSEMNYGGFFDDVQYCLCHLDLEPNNVMVDIRDDGSAVISGVLGWSSAVFAPEFVACDPPSWIWTWSGEVAYFDELDGADGPKANDTPSSAEQRELKCLFEEAVGPEYLKYSYSEEYRIGRQLFRLAYFGTHDPFEDADDVVKAWTDMYPRPPVSEFNRLRGGFKFPDDSHCIRRGEFSLISLSPW